MHPKLQDKRLGIQIEPARLNTELKDSSSVSTDILPGNSSTLERLTLAESDSSDLTGSISEAPREFHQHFTMTMKRCDTQPIFKMR
jgi:hypothetical protein